MEGSAFHRPRPLTVYREKSSSVKTLMENLAKAMSEFTPIVKDMTGVVFRKDAMGRSKESKYRYASLESLHRATKPALLKHGVVPSQEYCVSDEGVTLVTTLSYGDEFISSTLPIRSFEDQQRLKAHMSYMRRTAYEGILCLSAEDDSDGADEQLPEGHAAAEPSVNGVAASQLWKQQEDRAVKAIRDAATPAALDDILATVRKKIASSDMDPHCLGRLDEAAKQRIKEIKTVAAKHSPKVPQKVAEVQA